MEAAWRSRNQGEIDGPGLGIGKKDAPPVGTRLFALDELGRVELARLARDDRRPACAHRSSHCSRGRSAERRLQPCCVARHGRFQPGSGSAEHDFRTRQGLPRVSYARFHRSRADQGVREQAQSEDHAVYRLQQIRKHPRTQHLQAVFLRAHEADRRRSQGWRTLHCHNRSWIRVREGRYPR